MGRRCNRCGTLYPPHLVETAFRLDTSSRTRGTFRRKTICRACDQTSRDQRKTVNRWPVKARDVIRRHAVRLGVDKADLVGRYGWDPNRLAHDARYQYGNGCSYCGGNYAEMGHGLADITLDIIDRDRPPYYRSNTKWCCQTCNRKKGAMSSEDFEADRQMWELWRRNRQDVDEDPALAGRLF